MVAMDRKPSQKGDETPGRRPLRVAPDGVRRLRLTFTSDCTSASLCDVLADLDLPLTRVDMICVRYALMELLANALRASLEKHAGDGVCLEIWCDGDRLRFKASDSAGGFDVRLLPYDLNSSCDDVDLESEVFDQYRQRYHDTRFGLGLVSARTAVREFRLVFLDHAGREVPWKDDGSIKGTEVTFSMKMREGRNGAQR